MISLGKNIKQYNDLLEKITIKQLFDKIKNPHKDFINFIIQLRQVQAINPAKYRQLKTKLPYVVAGLFNPPYRKTENFANTNYFILDIDHLTDKEMDINLLLSKLKKDNRIVLAFRSPSGDGLKLFFKLAEPFYDHAKYSLFYKVFAGKFASEYSLSQVIDKKTSDVSRACFVSWDPEIWHNPHASPIHQNNYVDFNNELQLIEINQLLNNKDKETNYNKNKKTEEPPGQDLPDDIIKKIREKLNPKLVVKKEKQIVVPEELNEILNTVTQALNNFEIEVDEIISINYGKQFRLKAKHYRAEINVFYGKRGFSVVKSTKSGLNSQLVDAAYEIITSAIL